MEVIQRCFKTHAYFLLNFSPNCTTTISLAQTIKLYRYEKGPNHFHSIFVILTTIKMPIFCEKESPLGYQELYSIQGNLEGQGSQLYS